MKNTTFWEKGKQGGVFALIYTLGLVLFPVTCMLYPSTKGKEQNEMNKQIKNLIEEMKKEGFFAMAESLDNKADSIRDEDVQEVIEMNKLGMECY